MIPRNFQMVEVVPNDNLYPPLLLEVRDRPVKFYLLGSESNIERFGQLASGRVLAVVGTRQITSYGRQVTVDLVSKLCAFGVTIVSGLMYGVDEVAHRAAVDSGGFTVGVWAGGLDTIFGTSRENTANRVLEGGVILAEYDTGVVPQDWTFPQRNRIVAGMSQAVLVTEAAANSGSLITAGFAAEYGREVMAVPGPVTSSLSEGVNYLIKNGARVVSQVDDIFDVLGIKVDRENGKYLTLEEVRSLGENEMQVKILAAILNEGKDLDSLVRETGLSTADLTATVTILELANKIIKLDDKYSIR